MKRKSRMGIIVSDKMNKTRVVLVGRTVRHSTYKKVIHKTKRFYAHDEENISHTGDKVQIVETRPLSKTKRWRIVKVLEKAA